MGLASMIDWTINVASIVQILVLAAGAFAFVFAIKGDVSKVKENVADIKEELKELRKVFTTQVDHDGRLTRVEADIRDMRSDIKELRHGEGFVFPLKPVG
jgi:Tfp pilus assembly protein PilO